MTSTSHWTERSPEDFLYSIASDFIEDLKERMRSLGMSQTKLARAAKVNKSYISRIFKDPGNLSLDTIVKLARTVGMKVSIVPYEDPNDPNNERGPIGSDIFRWCWEHADRPADMWEIRDKTVTTANTLSLRSVLEGVVWGQNVFAASEGSTIGPQTPLALHTLPNVQRKKSTLAGVSKIGVPLKEVQYGGR